MKYPFAIAIHGGAGTLLRSNMSPQKEKLYQDALHEAVSIGYDVLKAGGTAIESVEKSIISLEDCELFNAGKGSVFTAIGTHEMDASIMDGNDLNSGAVSMISKIKNPISLAKYIMDHSQHVFLAGQGAEAFAFQSGFEEMPVDYFYTKERYDQWQDVKNTDFILLDHSNTKDLKFGTVGAVALDQFGNLSAGTSTGGMTNKKFGRIGDTPMIGSGTYADNTCGAISCTGSGEYFIRLNVAFHVLSMVKYGKHTLEEAGNFVIHKLLQGINGDGGLIAINQLGEIHMPFNTEGMYRAFKKSMGEELYIGIYK